jgi:hypothetical protein
MASIYNTILKNAMKNKFQFEKIESCKFIADQQNNTLGLIGSGYEKNSSILSVIKGKDLVLSEHSEYTSIFLSEIKTKINYDTLVYLDILFDYSKNIIESDIYYIKDGIKFNEQIITEL